MKKLRIYVDTSVLGGCFDPEFERWSNALMEDFRRGIYRPVLSEVTVAEIACAPEVVRRLHAGMASFAEVLPVTEEALDLTDTYETRQVLGRRFRQDMLHIAVASMADVDVLVSWNFKHIVRFDKIRQFKGINTELGYRTPEIYSPREVCTSGRDD